MCGDAARNNAAAAVGKSMEGMMVKEHKDVVSTMLNNIKTGVEGTTA